MSDVEKAARERRKARLRSGGNDRLRKITGTSGRPDFNVPTVNENRPPLAASASREVHDDDDPPVSSIAEHEAKAAPFDWKSILENMPQGSDHEGGQILGDKLFGTQQTDIQPQQTQQPTSQQQNLAYSSRQKVDKAWSIVHLLVALILGVVVSRVNPFGLAAYFVASEAGLQALRFALGHNVPPLMLASVSQFLPPQGQRLLNNGALYLQIGRTIYRDFCVVLVIYGLLSVGGSDFARPQILG